LPEPWPTTLRLVEQAAQNGLSCSAQVQDSGKTWDVIANVSLSEEVHDVVVIIRDMTPTIALQESLHRSEMMSAMGNLIAGVAHEVKNPLFGMSATLDAMESRFRGSAASLRYTSVIRQELDRLQLLMRDLLDYGSAANLDHQSVALGSIVESALGLCRKDAKTKGVAIDNTVAPGFGPCRADSHRLEQALRNVIDNAIRFSPAGEAVTITARHVADKKLYELEIRDHGPGFAAADLPRIFEPFFTKREGGTGLGLPIVRRMIEEHGGRVRAMNAPDHGAIVRIELPSEGR
ncbi:MAG: sensor histidine kinase, partial [Thermoanaerobaculia bacterium]